jgi:parvulin-like peptidyl-prolyl isomerase
MKPWSLCLFLLLVTASSAVAQSLTGTAPAATVNGEVITVDAWVARMQRLRYPDFVASTNPLRPRTGSAGELALEGLINTALVLQYAAKVSLVPTDAEIDAVVAEAKQNRGVADALKNKTLTEAALREDMKLQRTLYNVATVNRSVTPEEVARYYAAHPEKYGQPEQWRLALIRANSKATADKVAAELKAGKPFEDVATRLSDDAETRKRGGELGTIAHTDPSLPGFIRDAVSKLKSGETTPMITSNVGGSTPVHFFVRLLEKKEKVAVTLDQIRPQVERAALFEKVGGGVQKIAELRKDAKIVVHLPGYEGLNKN